MVRRQQRASSFVHLNGALPALECCWLLFDVEEVPGLAAPLNRLISSLMAPTIRSCSALLMMLAAGGSSEGAEPVLPAVVARLPCSPEAAAAAALVDRLWSDLAAAAACRPGASRVCCTEVDAACEAAPGPEACQSRLAPPGAATAAVLAAREVCWLELPGTAEGTEDAAAAAADVVGAVAATSCRRRAATSPSNTARARRSASADCSEWQHVIGEGFQNGPARQASVRCKSRRSRAMRLCVQPFKMIPWFGLTQQYAGLIGILVAQSCSRSKQNLS